MAKHRARDWHCYFHRPALFWTGAGLSVARPGYDVSSPLLTKSRLRVGSRRIPRGFLMPEPPPKCRGWLDVSGSKTKRRLNPSATGIPALLIKVPFYKSLRKVYQHLLRAGARVRVPHSLPTATVSNHECFAIHAKAGRDAVNSGLILAMKAIISGHRSKHADEFQGHSFYYPLTVCDDAKEGCPAFPGHPKRLHRAFDDPAVFQGAEVEWVALFRRVPNEIERSSRSLSVFFNPESRTVTLALKGIPDSISPAHQDPFQIRTR